MYWTQLQPFQSKFQCTSYELQNLCYAACICLHAFVQVDHQAISL
uniref:Uncharacterized protein n=1 Tax=Rhizophora mucronata TaxID=61149 RepID=A0A2P2LWK1_RHIMU